MKKSLKNLSLKKETISKLDLSTVKGGWHATAMCRPIATNFCPTQGALNSCPPPGVQCFQSLNCKKQNILNEGNKGNFCFPYFV